MKCNGKGKSKALADAHEERKKWILYVDLSVPMRRKELT